MKYPKIITNKTGARCLVCTYHGDGYDAAMTRAEDSCGVRGDADVTIIAIPNGLKIFDNLKALSKTD